MLPLSLDRDLCFLDIEATGLNVLRDRIIQIGILKYPKDGGEGRELSLLINPGIPISPEAMQVHGIQPKDVAKKPTFAQVADKILEFIGNADLAGYNSSRFDIPMLMEEFDRVGIQFDVQKRRLLDMQRIFYKMEPRTLKAAYKFYCDKDLEGAHDAMTDVRATAAVFLGQLERYQGADYLDEDGNVVAAPVRPDVKALHEFCNDQRFVDATQKFRYDHNGDIVFNFGKYANQPAAPLLSKDKQYYNWMLNKEFSAQVKQIVRQLVRDYETTKDKP